MEGSKTQQDTAFLAVVVDKSKPASLLSGEEKMTKMHAFLPLMELASSCWSLSFAFIYGAMAAHDLYGDITCDQSSYCYYQTGGSAGDEATKLVTAMLWTSVAQAAVAVLALLLGCCRRALAAAVVSLGALGLAVANHCMMARTRYLFLTAYPGDALLISSIVLASLLVVMGLLICFLALLVILELSGDDQE